VIISLFPDLKKRSNDIELMDNPGSDEKKLLNTVKQFKIINILFSRSRYLIKKHIIKEALKNPEKTYTFLDLGAGGCDISYWVLRKCKSYGINIKLICLDNDIRIINYIKKRFQSVKNLKIINGSAFELEKIGKVDFVFTNHFLHHLPLEKIPDIIRHIAKYTNKVFLLNDIYRSYFAYFGLAIFCKIFLHNSFAFYDGRLSIRKGFRDKELKIISNNTDIKDFNFKIKRIFPSRVYFVGKNQNIE
jgi:phospholipid N-methyltransferase